MTAAESLTVRRLSDIGDWEFYKLIPASAGKEDAMLVIGLRPYTEFRQVEYEIWEEQAEEPRLTGSVPCEVVGGRWVEANRELILEEIFRSLSSKE